MTRVETQPLRRRVAAGLRGAVLAVLVVAPLPALAASPYEQDQVRWLGEMRHIAFFAPPSAGEKSPLLLVLGEPGRGARYALDSWRGAAEREGFVVASVSSQTGNQWRAPHDGPGLLRAMVQRIAGRHAVDRRRVYLFGYGFGSGFALAMGALQPRYFAAAAGFDGDVLPGSLRALGQLERELPVYIFHSKRYPQFDVDALGRTAAELQELGARATVEKLAPGGEGGPTGLGGAERPLVERGSAVHHDPLRRLTLRRLARDSRRGPAARSRPPPDTSLVKSVVWAPGRASRAYLRPRRSMPYTPPVPSTAAGAADITV